MLSKVRTSFRICVGWSMYVVSFLVPRNPRLWVFYGWHRNGDQEYFADNCKYFFLYASQYGKDARVRAVWLSPDASLVTTLRKTGHEAYTENSIQGVYCALRAGYTIIDSNMGLKNWRHTAKSKIIQLWHGVPTKKIAHQTTYAFKDKNPSKFLSPQLRSQPYINVSTSEWYSKVSAEAFQYPPETFHIVGYPRNDALFQHIKGSEIDVPDLPILKKPMDGSTLLYVPTFRPGGANPLDHMDLSRLFQFLERYNSVLYMLLHPKLAAYRPEWEERFATRILFIEGGKDIYPLLQNFNACITDYSSTATDFLLTNRPVVYYQYDIDTYSKNPGLQDNASELTPGFKAQTFDELLTALTKVVLGDDPFTKERDHTLLIAFKDRDAESSERLFNLLCNDIAQK